MFKHDSIECSHGDIVFLEELVTKCQNQYKRLTFHLKKTNSNFMGSFKRHLEKMKEDACQHH